MPEARNARWFQCQAVIGPYLKAALLCGLASPALPGELGATRPQLTSREADAVTRALEAPLASDYEEAVNDLFGTLLAARGLLIVCSEVYPEHGEANAAGYERWRQQQGAAIAEIESHGKALIFKQSGGVQAVASEVEARLYQQMGDGYARKYRAEAPDDFAAACATYPEVIARTFDYEAGRAGELELIRSAPEPVHSE